MLDGRTSAPAGDALTAPPRRGSFAANGKEDVEVGVDPRSVAEGTPRSLTAHALRIMAVAMALALALSPAVARAAAPSITYTISGTQGSNGWYVGPVTVRWSVSGNYNDSPGCEPAVLIPDDTTGTTRTCSASGSEGTASSTTSIIRIDQTPPVASAVTAARAPDHDGWYTSPVAVGWSGTDATSGIDVCTALTYAGPDAAPVPLSGTCRDRAGNTSAPLGFSLEYDATPPAPPRLSATAGDQAVALAWPPFADASSVTVTRSPGVAGAPASTVYEGTATSVRDRGLRNGVRYTYTVTAADPAGNTAARSVAATPASFLALPPLGALFSTSKPPVLRWKAVKPARYYNVQIFRGRHQVLSAWPTHSRLQLRSSWRYRNRLRHLAPGVYRWYVWPGYGARRGRHYGRLLGRSEFTIPG
jgi:hypothetical protein